MPMKYVYICPHCGASSGEVTGLPETWLSVNVTHTEAQGLGASTEYFDSWNCVAVYAGERHGEQATS